MGGPVALAPHDPSAAPASAARTLRFLLGLAGLFGLTAGAGLLAWAIAPVVHPDWEASVVASGSMAPRIQAGDVVLWQDAAAPDVGPGTVIVFRDAADRRTLHRIHAETSDGRYVTRGDANPVPDRDEVERADIEGIGHVLVPLVGTPNLWMREGRTGPLAVLLAGIALAAWASRYVWDEAFDPWAAGPHADGLRGLASEPLGIGATLRVPARPSGDDAPLVHPNVRAVLVDQRGPS